MRRDEKPQRNANYAYLCATRYNDSEEWPWSSVHHDAGSINRGSVTLSGLSANRILPPADEQTRI
jgi:hypothetical protein